MEGIHKQKKKCVYNGRHETWCARLVYVYDELHVECAQINGSRTYKSQFAPLFGSYLFFGLIHFPFSTHFSLIASLSHITKFFFLQNVYSSPILRDFSVHIKCALSI